MNNNPGGLPYVPKPNDWQYRDVGAGFPAFDWEKGYDIEKVIGKRLPVGKQSPTSCGGWAFANYAAALEAIQSGSLEQRSAHDQYSRVAVIQNGNPIGSRMGDNADTFRNQGIALESLFPSYENGMTASDGFMLQANPGPEAIASRKLAQAFNTAYVQSQIDLVAQAIAINGGLVTLLGAQNNGTWKKKFPKPPSYRQWGHFMYAGKALLINEKKYIGYLNSFGADAGEEGWQFLGEDYIASGFIEANSTAILRLPPVASFKFTRDLYFGVSGPDVKMLQKFLNHTAFPVTTSGPGSPGQETAYFGALTRTALAKYQAANGISPSVGYLGPITRTHINSL